MLLTEESLKTSKNNSQREVKYSPRKFGHSLFLLLFFSNCDFRAIFFFFANAFQPGDRFAAGARYEYRFSLVEPMQGKTPTVVANFECSSQALMRAGALRLPPDAAINQLTRARKASASVRLTPKSIFNPEPNSLYGFRVSLSEMRSEDSLACVIFRNARVI